MRFGVQTNRGFLSVSDYFKYRLRIKNLAIITQNFKTETLTAFNPTKNFLMENKPLSNYI